MRSGVNGDERDELLRGIHEEYDPHEGMGAVVWPLGIMVAVILFLCVAFATGLVRFEKKRVNPVPSEGVKGGGR